MIASATANTAVEAVISAIPTSNVKGDSGPRQYQACHITIEQTKDTNLTSVIQCLTEGKRPQGTT